MEWFILNLLLLLRFAAPVELPQVTSPPLAIEAPGAAHSAPVTERGAAE